MGILYVVDIPDGFDINEFLEEFKDQFNEDGEEVDLPSESGVLETFEILMKDGEVWEDQVPYESWSFLGETLRWKKKLTISVTDIPYEGKIMLTDK